MDDAINFKIYLQSSSNWPTGKTEIQKFEYLKNEKSHLDKIKSIFHNYSRAIIWWKMENNGHKVYNNRNIFLEEC